MRAVLRDLNPDLLLDMNAQEHCFSQSNMKTPLSTALLAACQWLKRHPDLRANPGLLLEFVSAWCVVAGPITEQEARQCGIHAVKEVAGCRKDSPLPEPELIEPEDLRD